MTDYALQPDSEHPILDQDTCLPLPEYVPQELMLCVERWAEWADEGGDMDFWIQWRGVGETLIKELNDLGVDNYYLVDFYDMPTVQ